MSDIQDKINKILSDPEALKQLQGLGAQLGLSGDSPVSQPSSPPPAPAPIASGVNGELMSALTKFAPMISGFSEDDDVSRLLHALRPFLSEEKQQKLDRAQRLMKLVRIIPLIKDSGIFNL